MSMYSGLGWPNDGAGKHSLQRPQVERRWFVVPRRTIGQDERQFQQPQRTSECHCICLMRSLHDLQWAELDDPLISRKPRNRCRCDPSPSHHRTDPRLLAHHCVIIQHRRDRRTLGQQVQLLCRARLSLAAVLDHWRAYDGDRRIRTDRRAAAQQARRDPEDGDGSRPGSQCASLQKQAQTESRLGEDRQSIGWGENSGPFRHEKPQAAAN